MTKPLTHALPYMVGMLVGHWLHSAKLAAVSKWPPPPQQPPLASKQTRRSLTTLLGFGALCTGLAEVFLPYQWNNSHLPSRLVSAMYAAVFRFGWSLVLAYVVVCCRHRRGSRCAAPNQADENYLASATTTRLNDDADAETSRQQPDAQQLAAFGSAPPHRRQPAHLCMCGSGGNLINRLLSSNVFTHLSKLSFVAYLIHLPLMSMFVGQTRGLFAFSHTLVIHLALSYLVTTLVLSFVLVHIIEFPFITFERYLFEKVFYKAARKQAKGVKQQRRQQHVGLVPSFLSSPAEAPQRQSSLSAAARVDFVHNTDNCCDQATLQVPATALVRARQEQADSEPRARRAPPSSQASSQQQQFCQTI